MEQIFGDIEDEHDVQELVEKRLGEDEWLFSARHDVEYLNERYNLAIAESDEYDTLAGYIIAEHGGIPHEGEELNIGEFRIKIVRREQSRIDLVSLKRTK